MVRLRMKGYSITFYTLTISFALLCLFVEPQTNNSTASFVPWSRRPPGDLRLKDIPQLVSITFDDNFGLAHPDAKGGIDFIVEFYKDRKNPAGSGNPDNFDGAPIKATFYHTSIYLVDESRKVLGGEPGEDQMGRNRKAWSAAFKAGHEAGVHTVNHFNGGAVALTSDDWGRPRNWSPNEWAAEIQSCKDTLTGSQGIGAKPEEILGFRTPFLAYNDNLFTALTNLKFTYDTTLPNCFDDQEDGRNCSWPYTLDNGSPDMDVILRKFSNPSGKMPFSFPKVTQHLGLWEIPPTTLIVPPDGMASRYGVTPGMRERIAKRAPLPYPSIYEPSTGKIAGLDYTLLMDAGLTGKEMSAVLKYNLDLHIAGNRSPLVFVAHSHLYTYSNPENNPDTPSAVDRDARWNGLTDFITYALSKPETRIVAAKDVLGWVQRAANSTPGK